MLGTWTAACFGTLYEAFSLSVCLQVMSSASGWRTMGEPALHMCVNDAFSEVEAS